MVREVAGYDYDTAERVMGWPLKEVLLAYIDRLREAALEQYSQTTLIWAIQSPYARKPPKPPRVPAILK